MTEPTTCDPSAMPDDRFLDDFLAARLPAAAFDHRGHLRAAWLLLRREPLDDAIDAVCRGIQRLAAALGAPGKYHRTLSEAMVRLVAQRAEAEPGGSWPGFLAAHPDLVNDARALLARHYTPETLASDAARRHFVAPDRCPLPR